MAMSSDNEGPPSGERVSSPGGPAQRLKSSYEFSLHDVESVRLILKGGSVIDWHRLNFDDAEQVRRFIREHEFDPDDPNDRAYTESIKSQAIAYLRRNFAFAIPKPVETASLEE